MTAETLNRSAVSPPRVYEWTFELFLRMHVAPYTYDVIIGYSVFSNVLICGGEDAKWLTKWLVLKYTEHRHLLYRCSDVETNESDISTQLSCTVQVQQNMH